MKANRVDACRELYRGSFKKAQYVACLAGMLALAVLLAAKNWGYLPDHFSTSRIVLGPVVTYGMALAAMMWFPGRALKKSRRLDDAEAVVPTPSHG